MICLCLLTGIYCLKWENPIPTRIKYQRRLSVIRWSKIVQAVAVPAAPSPADSSPFPAEREEYRKQLCENYGFKQIGEPLPENVTLKDIVGTLPKKVFEIDDVKAWKSVLISVSSYVLGLFMISKAPWFLLPLAWAWTGTAITGFFVIGHDCAHKSFSKNKLLEDTVGTLAFLPLIYPYEPWRFKHDQHHAKTNMLYEDTAWHPVWREEFDSSPALRNAIIYGYGPFRPWMSLAHWLKWHFNTKNFRPNEIKRVKISLACVFAFIGIGWPLIVYKTGIMGWIQFWLMPWLGYHFWVNTISLSILIASTEPRSKPLLQVKPCAIAFAHADDEFGQGGKMAANHDDEGVSSVRSPSSASTVGQPQDLENRITERVEAEHDQDVLGSILVNQRVVAPTDSIPELFPPILHMGEEGSSNES
ncbi:Omega-6 fatty acid desaturase, chloroplastic [Sarracenia purpurea var. burkii]